jgi:hypothetical protein
MAALAKTLISKTILSTDQSNIVFDNISTSYTSLEIIYSIRGSSTSSLSTLGYPNNAMSVLFNSNAVGNTNCGANSFNARSSDVYTNYTYPTRNDTFNSYRMVIGNILTNGNTSNCFTSGNLQINMASNTGSTKIIQGHMSGYDTASTGLGTMTRFCGSYSSTTAITKIDLSLMTGSFIANSSFSLYGITTA